MGTSLVHPWQRPPGRLALRLASAAAAAGLGAAAVAALVPAAHALALVPTLLLAAIVAVLAWSSRRIDRSFRATVRLAYVDDVTGLPNRASFVRAAGAALEEAPGREAAVLVLDLERFREVDDALGRASGDRLLSVAAERLAALEPVGVVVACLGAGEFGMLVRANPTVARTVARRAIAALGEPFDLDGIAFPLGCSAGIALAPLHGADAETLLRRASVALHDARSRGSGFSLYDRALDPEADPAPLAPELARALEREELVLYYQPKLGLESGRVEGVEALLRWRHPDRGLLMPDAFVPFAERTGAIRLITRYLLDRAVRQCSVWQAAEPELHVSVNLTARDLADAGLVDELALMLAEAGLPAERLVLEIAESAIARDPFRVRRILLGLGELGVRVAVDDFGAGLSSLGYLKLLPVDELKIDRSFVASMATDAESAARVRATIALGRNLGLTVVAAGVESADQLERLKALGCDAAQGWFVGPPVPAEELTGRLFAFAEPSLPRLKLVR